jgi:hypothetical protein
MIVKLVFLGEYMDQNFPFYHIVNVTFLECIGSSNTNKIFTPFLCCIIILPWQYQKDIEKKNGNERKKFQGSSSL